MCCVVLLLFVEVVDVLAWLMVVAILLLPRLGVKVLGFLNHLVICCCAVVRIGELIFSLYVGIFALAVC